MKVITSVSLLSLALLAWSCESAPIGQDPDGGCSGPSCTDGASCLDGGCDEPIDEPIDPCAAIRCPEGQDCLEGRCRAVDLCAGVSCANPGDVCDPRDGACHAGAADEDGDGYSLAAGDCDDGDGAIHPGAAEQCDGVDQDCDREVDEGYPDEDDDGFDTCGFGDPAQADCDDRQAARSPGQSERCDGLDNDCNDIVDDGLSPHPCETACGSGEERCEGGRWACSAPVTCECTPPGSVEDSSCGNCGLRARSCGSDLRWSDWSPCSGEGLCAAGALETRSCGDCGEETRSCSATCSWGAYGACLGEGVCSPLDAEPCTTSCGSTGLRSCEPSCTWGGCVAPAESCNGLDDDCDGELDEGFRAEVVATTFATLASYYAPCDGATAPRIGLECNTAIHRFCAARGCSVSGYGPVEWSGDDVWVVCVAGASVESPGYPGLAAELSWCDGSDGHQIGAGCSCAAKRYCAGLGDAVSGFGPQETQSGGAQVSCVTGGVHVQTSFTVLSSFNFGCDGVTSLWGPYCHSAIHRFCRSLGHTSGIGPVENDVAHDIAWVLCVFP